MKKINLDKILLGLVLIPSVLLVSSSFISPNSNEFPDHKIDKNYQSDPNEVSFINRNENNLIPPNLFKKEKGVIKASKRIVFDSNTEYTFAIQLSDYRSLIDTMATANHYIEIDYSIEGVSGTNNYEHSNICRPQYFLNSFKTLNKKEPMGFKIALDEKNSRILAIIHSYNSSNNKKITINKFDFAFNAAKHFGNVVQIHAYKGNETNYKEYEDYSHAPAGLNNDFTGPFKDKTELDINVRYKEKDMLTVNDFKNTILAFDKYDYEYKNVEIKSDSYTNATRNLNTKLPIVFIAKDNNNNEATITFNITVFDDENPKIKPLHDTIKFSYKEDITLEKIRTKFQITDNYTKNPEIIVNGISLNQKLSVGNYPIEIVAKDSSNNQETYKSTLQVIDDVLPELTGPSFIQTNVNTLLSENEIIKMYEANDEIDKKVPISIENNTYKDNYRHIGVYSLIVNATDRSGNKISKTVSVSVSDLNSPIFYLNQKVLTTYENSTINLQTLLNQLVKENIIPDDNYIDVKVKSQINIDKPLIKGEYTLSLECILDNSSSLNVPITLKVIEKEKDINIFARFFQYIKEIFDKIF